MEGGNVSKDYNTNEEGLDYQSGISRFNNPDKWIEHLIMLNVMPKQEGKGT